MSNKWITLSYLTFFFMNVFHVYHICDQYFYYDVTTNTRIGFPETARFPSMTLCPVLVSLLKWEKMSTDLRRSLLQAANPELTNETLLSQMAGDPSLIGPEVKFHDTPFNKIPYNIYNRLVKELSIGMIFNLTASFHEVFPVFLTSILTYNSLGSEEDKMLEDRPTSGKFQFTIDSIYIYERCKCWTLNIRPELNKINFDELRSIYNEPRRFLVSWYTLARTQVRAYIHDKGYLVNTQDDKTSVHSGARVRTEFVSHESILLEYPYKTNCRDYTKIGFTSRKHCKEMCFKSKTFEKYNALLEDSHAFESDNMFFNESQYPWTNQSIVQFFTGQCRTDCEEKDCQSVAYHKQDAVSLTKENFTSQFFVPAHHVITFTKTQPAIPLVSFLTELLSTFGFWMGLSVTGSLRFVRKTFSKVTSFRHERKSRQRLTPQ